MTWQDQLPACFAEGSLAFAPHPADEERAFALLTRLRDENVGLAAVNEAVVDYLKGADAGATHIEQQTERVAMFFGPWLLD